MSKELMGELQSLTEANGRNAHRVATIIRSLLNDRKWIDVEWKGNRDEAEHELSKFSKRMALSIDSLLTMLEFFPKVEDWDGADLEDLRWRSAAELNKRQQARREKQRAAEQREWEKQTKHAGPKPAATEPKQITVSEEIAEVKEQLRVEVKQATSRAISLQQENDQLRAEVRHLKLEYARLHDRYESLKAQLVQARSKYRRKDRRVRA